MSETVSRLLERRLGAPRLRPRRAGLLGSLALHLALGLSLLLTQILLAQRRATFEFVDVEVVSSASLPQSRPRAQPKESEAQKPEPRRPPEPQPPLPEPDAPALPPEKKPKPKPAPSEPASQPSEEPAPDPNTPIAADGPVSVLPFDNPDFNYGYYVDRMLALIRSQWVRPPVGGDVELVVHFTILLDGTVRDLEIVTASGFRSFDQAGMRAVQSASPLPPLPRGYRHDSLGVTLIIR